MLGPHLKVQERPVEQGQSQLGDDELAHWYPQAPGGIGRPGDVASCGWVKRGTWQRGKWWGQDGVCLVCEDLFLLKRGLR